MQGQELDLRILWVSSSSGDSGILAFCEHVCAFVIEGDHLHSEKGDDAWKLPWDLTLWAKLLSLISSASQGLGTPLVIP